MQPCYFHFLVQIWTVYRTLISQGLLPELLTTQVQRCIVWTNKQIYWIRKPMRINLYMRQKRSKVSVFKLRLMLKLF